MPYYFILSWERNGYMPYPSEIQIVSENLNLPCPFSSTIIITPDVCIYPTALPQAGFDTRSIFEQSTANLNSEFSIQISCLTKAKELSLSYYLPITGGRRDGFTPFLKWNTYNFGQDLNSSGRFHFLRW